MFTQFVLKYPASGIPFLNIVHLHVLMAPAPELQKLHMRDLKRQHHTLKSGEKAQYVCLGCSEMQHNGQRATISSISYQYLNCRTSSVYSQNQS